MGERPTEGDESAGDADGVRRLAAWLLGGVAVGGTLGYLLIAVAGAPLSLQVGVGLGVALGGGLGAVANLLATDAEPSGSQEETVDVDMGDRESKTPRPADLFEDHPDPVLYVADEGHGPVVRAANAAYADAFGVPASGVEGAPLSDAVMSDEGTDDVVDAVAADRSLDVVVGCETPDGDRQFRLRVAGDREDCYLVYTPVEW